MLSSKCSRFNIESTDNIFIECKQVKIDVWYDTSLCRKVFRFHDILTSPKWKINKENNFRNLNIFFTEFWLDKYRFQNDIFHDFIVFRWRSSIALERGNQLVWNLPPFPTKNYMLNSEFYTYMHEVILCFPSIWLHCNDKVPNWTKVWEKSFSWLKKSNVPEQNTVKSVLCPFRAHMHFNAKMSPM